MKPFYHAICKPDINIPVERQVPNKIYSIALLSIKILILIACIGIGVSGAILYKFLFLKSFAIKLHLLFSYWAFILSMIQLGISIGITVLPRFKEKIQKIVFYASYIVSVAGIIFLIKSELAVSLIQLNKNLILLSTVQMFFILLGFVSLGIAFNHFIKRITKLKG
ncbi:hypothetical protein [Ruminococcus flavefaciens]|uniref:hypothetical protein n=1 Tax=Ruminococcus flavefaciens TaxID=1265 RepID=UPI0018AFA073|nr:hypothetical protein [Ruminococcus flavefaciens]